MSSRSGAPAVDVEVAALGRDRHHPVVVDAQHLELVQVDQRNHAVHRVGPLAVAGLRPHEGDRAPQPDAVLALVSEVTRRPGIDLHRLEVGDSALGHRRLELGVQPHQLLGLHQLADHRHRLDVGPHPPAGHGRRVERHRRPPPPPRSRDPASPPRQPAAAGAPPALQAATDAFTGSASSMVMKRVSGDSSANCRWARTVAAAVAISAAESGSSGCSKGCIPPIDSLVSRNRWLRRQ